MLNPGWDGAKDITKIDVAGTVLNNGERVSFIEKLRNSGLNNSLNLPKGQECLMLCRVSLKWTEPQDSNMIRKLKGNRCF